MSGGEFAAIEARWTTDGGIGNAGRTTEETDAICAEYAFRDIPALLAAVRERDNTIARVWELHVKGPSEGGCNNRDCQCHGYPTCLHCNEYNAKGVIWPCATIAALDPQETP